MLKRISILLMLSIVFVSCVDRQAKYNNIPTKEITVDGTLTTKNINFSKGKAGAIEFIVFPESFPQAPGLYHFPKNKSAEYFFRISSSEPGKNITKKFDAIRWISPIGMKVFVLNFLSQNRSIQVEVKENILQLFKIEKKVAQYNRQGTRFSVKVIPYKIDIPLKEESLSDLEKLLQHKDWVIRWHVVDVLSKFSDKKKITNILSEVVKTEKKEEVQTKINEVLKNLK